MHSKLLIPSWITTLIISILLINLVLANAESNAAAAPSKQHKKSLLVVFDHAVRSDKRQELIRSAGGDVRKDLRPLLDAVSLSVDESNLTQVKGTIEKSFRNSVKYIEEDKQVQLLHHSDISTTTPTPSSEYQDFGAWSVAHIGSYLAYQKHARGEGIKVAVLDSGIDYNHPDLVASYAGGYNFVSLNSDPLDDAGHGTFVSGIIAANDDGSGIIGVAPDSQLYALKVLDSNGIGYISDIISALQWCIDHNIDIVSMSFGLQSYDSPALHDIISTAYSHGIVLVAAAGNVPGIVDYPAAYGEVIAVGAADSNDSRASFSATGSSLELVAPGVRVVSTYPYRLGGPYHSDDGTSAAAPHVAGVAALIKATDERLWYPDITNGDSIWTNDEIRKVLDTTAVDLGPQGKDSEYGYGRVDAANAVRSSSSSMNLLINTEELNGNPIYGYYAVLSQSGSIITTDFSPASFSLINGQEYQIAVADYGNYVFDHWSDTGSKSRERSVLALSNTTYIQYSAAYRNVANESNPSSEESPQQPSVEIKSVDSTTGDSINGYYVTLSQGGNIIASGFTPARFTILAGEEYQVSVQDYGSYFFNKWLLPDGGTASERTVIVSGGGDVEAEATNSSSITLTAAYDNSNNNTPSPQPPPSEGQSSSSMVSVITEDGQGNLISGYYTTLWHEGSLVNRTFSPATFTVNDDGLEYQIAVADYGNYVFDHWKENDSTERLHTVVISGNGTSSYLTAVYRESNK
jgi:subtilisin